MAQTLTPSRTDLLALRRESGQVAGVSPGEVDSTTTLPRPRRADLSWHPGCRVAGLGRGR